jgi:hypothetical protein
MPIHASGLQTEESREEGILSSSLVRANVRRDLPGVCQLDKPRQILINAIQLLVRGDELQHHVRFAGNAHSCPQTQTISRSSENYISDSDGTVTVYVNGWT